jgi:hypothetical protein
MAPGRGTILRLNGRPRIMNSKLSKTENGQLLTSPNTPRRLFFPLPILQHFHSSLGSARMLVRAFLRKAWSATLSHSPPYSLSLLLSSLSSLLPSPSSPYPLPGSFGSARMLVRAFLRKAWSATCLIPPPYSLSLLLSSLSSLLPSLSSLLPSLSSLLPSLSSPYPLPGSFDSARMLVRAFLRKAWSASPMLRLSTFSSRVVGGASKLHLPSHFASSPRLAGLRKNARQSVLAESMVS